MNVSSRFDVAGLRNPSRPDSGAEVPGRPIRPSRRAFLGLSAAGSAFAFLPPLARGEGFGVVREGEVVHLTVGGKPRWTLDPVVFGDRAAVSVRHDSLGAIHIQLRDAFFPGTTLAASGEWLLLKQASDWVMRCTLDCGITASAPLLAWLLGQVTATGRWKARGVRLFPNAAIAFSPGLSVEMLPNWIIRMDGGVAGRVRDLCGSFRARGGVLRVNPPERIAADAQGRHATTFSLLRDSEPWPVQIGAPEGAIWDLTHDAAGELFDELHLEAVVGVRNLLHSAMFSQSSARQVSVRWFPGGGLQNSDGEPFHFTLNQPRFVHALNEAPRSWALIAEVADQSVWAHGTHASYLFETNPDAPLFTLLHDGQTQQTPAVTPAVSQICFPHDDTCVALHMKQPEPVHFNFGAAVTEFFERGLAWFHLLPSVHDFDMCFGEEGGARLQIERPQDMLSLGFEFKHLQLRTGGKARVVPSKSGKPGQVTVIFPPQHVGEEAFFHTDDKPKVDLKVPIGPADLNNGDDSTPAGLEKAKQLRDADYANPKPVKIDPVPPRTRLSGESRLVFELPENVEIPFHIPDLLNWSAWKLRVAEVAKTGVGGGDYDELPRIERPRGTGEATGEKVADVTSIELPYSLMISPSDRSAWAHSTTPVQADTGVVELWHTRLASATGPKATSSKPKPSDTRVNQTIVDETNVKDRVIRAIWCPDFVPFDRSNNQWTDPGNYKGHPDGFRPHFPDKDALDPFRMSLDARDHVELVHLTSDYRIPQAKWVDKDKPDETQRLLPLPVGVDHLMLTSVGGYLKSLGAWDPVKIDINHQLTVEQWRHIATLGRDQYVRVVYKGFLVPFGHRAALVKVTERKLITIAGSGVVAILHQRMFIVIHDPIKNYPVLGQPNQGREMPFRRIEMLTLITPDLDDPSTAAWSPVYPGVFLSQSLFRPRVGNQPYSFRLRFTDWASQTSEASIPLVFADAEVAQRKVIQAVPTGTPPAGSYATSADACRLFNEGKSDSSLTDDPWKSADFASQKVSFAPSTKKGDTQYDAAKLAFLAEGPPTNFDPIDLYKNGLPYFYPSLDYARIGSASIKRITGNSNPSRVVFFPAYLTGGFDPKVNRGEVILQIHDDQKLSLSFGGNSGNVDKAGGLASPDTAIAGFSRRAGPVGGVPTAVTTAPVPATAPSSPPSNPSLGMFSSGNFHAADFFSGLTSAKILGGIKLADIIAPLAPGLADNLEKAPKMIEQLAYQIEDELANAEAKLNDVALAVQKFQTAQIPVGDSTVANPFAPSLSARAAAVSAANAAVAAAHQRSKDAALDPIRSLATAVAEGDAVRQFIGSVADYASALDDLLHQPQALAEQAVLAALTPIVSSYAAQATTAFTTAATAFLDQTLNTAITAATPLLVTLASIAQQTYADAVAQADAFEAQVAIADQRLTLALSEYAPQLFAIQKCVPAIQDAITRTKNIIAGTVFANLPGAIDNLTYIADDLLQIYQTAGLLGLVTANPGLIKKVTDAEAMLDTAWLALSVLPSNIQALRDTFQATCLAAAANLSQKQATALLQNMRQFQQASSAVFRYVGYATAWPSTAPSRQPNDLLRLHQLIRQNQRQVLASLAAIESLCGDPDSGLSGALGGDPTAFKASLTSFASLYSVSSTLSATNPVIGQLATLLTDTAVAGPIASRVNDIETRIAAAKKLIDAGGDILSVRLLHYDLTLQLRDPLLAIHQFSLFNSAISPKTVADVLATLTQLNTLAQAIGSQLTQVLARTACTLYSQWTAFQSSLGAGTSSVLAAVAVVFKPSLDNVDKQFKAVCDDLAAVPPAAYSLTLSDVHALLAALQAFVQDVRSRVADASTFLKALPAEALAAAEAYAEQQLTTLIAKIVPTSVSLSYDWHPDVQSCEPVFIVGPNVDFSVTARANVNVLDPAKASFDVIGKLSDFSINLIGSPSFIIVTIDSLIFTSHNGSKPDCHVAIRQVTFGGDMGFVKSLADALDPATGPFIELADGGITAGYRFTIDALPSSPGMTVMGLAIEVAINLPFDGSPVRLIFGLADQQHPFLIAFGIYGGGGFLQLQIGVDGVKLLQGAFEFGLVSSVTIGPLVGYGFIVAGIYFRIGGDKSIVCGFVHAHGHMDIFGIISLDVDLYVDICYEDGKVQGHAEFSVHVSILFFSATYHMTAQYAFGGSSSADKSYLDQPRETWQAALEYPQGFAPYPENAAFLVDPDPAPAPPIPAGPKNNKDNWINPTVWKNYINKFDFA